VHLHQTTGTHSDLFGNRDHTTFPVKSIFKAIPILAYYIKIRNIIYLGNIIGNAMASGESYKEFMYNAFEIAKNINHTQE
jgi:hypothetical protein